MERMIKNYHRKDILLQRILQKKATGEDNKHWKKYKKYKKMKYKKWKIWWVE